MVKLTNPTISKIARENPRFGYVLAEMKGVIHDGDTQVYQTPIPVDLRLVECSLDHPAGLPPGYTKRLAEITKGAGESGAPNVYYEITTTGMEGNNPSILLKVITAGPGDSAATELRIDLEFSDLSAEPTVAWAIR
jgi:hypothetical protein